MDKMRVVLDELILKSQDAMTLLEASVSKLTPIDPTKKYTPDELEPYDAMTSRFERFYEILASKCFRGYEEYVDGESLGSLRDLLNRMSKRGILVGSADQWINLRNLRNRIAHDYLPARCSEMQQSIIDSFPILKRTLENLINSL